MKEKTHSNAEKEMERLGKDFDEFKENVDSLTLDRMNAAPKLEIENQTKLSQNELFKAKEIYLKPYKTIGCQDKFNENYREEYNFAKEYVNFIAENKEIIGEDIDMWTRPFAGMPAEEWKVPVNKPVWGPRYLAEQLRGCSYHRLIMQPNVGSGSDHAGQYYGSMAVDTTLQRLDATPVAAKRSVFMGSKTF